LDFLFLGMIYFVYVLYSLKDHKLYKGFTSDVAKRLLRHNAGKNTSTAKRIPFVLIHIESFHNKTETLKRELYLKSLEGGVKLKSFLVQQGILTTEHKLHGNW
jgi:putative endonuclease